MKAVDTGRETVTLTAMEQFAEKELRIFQDNPEKYRRSVERN